MKCLRDPSVVRQAGCAKSPMLEASNGKSFEDGGGPCTTRVQIRTLSYCMANASATRPDAACI